MLGPRDEDYYWESQIDELRRTGLKSVRENAAKWQGTIAAFLGVFGAVAFIKGPGTFKDLGVDDAISIGLVGVVFLAAVLAFAAIYLTARTAQGIPRVHYMTGDELKAWTQRTAARSIRSLAIARKLTLIAGLLVLGGALAVVALALTQPAPSVRAIVKRSDGPVLCGVLQRSSGVQLVVGGQTIDLTRADDIEVVARCP